MKWHIDDSSHWSKKIFLGPLLGIFSYFLVLLTVIFSPLLMLINKKYEVRSSFGDNFEITFKGEIKKIEDSEVIDS